MLGELLDLPLVEVLDICHCVDQATRLHHVRVVREQRCVDDPAPVVRLFKVGIGETKEDFLDLWTKCDERVFGGLTESFLK